LRIPHPYSIADAERFIAMVGSGEGKDAIFAITLRGKSGLVGSTGLHVQTEHGCAELGYWIGVPYWGRGIATEAAGAVVWYGLEVLKLHRIYASYFSNNEASGKVLQKFGMKYEGRQRGAVLKWGEYLDVNLYGILATDPRPAFGPVQVVEEGLPL